MGRGDEGGRRCAGGGSGRGVLMPADGSSFPLLCRWSRCGRARHHCRARGAAHVAGVLHFSVHSSEGNFWELVGARALRGCHTRGGVDDVVVVIAVGEVEELLLQSGGLQQDGRGRCLSAPSLPPFLHSQCAVRQCGSLAPNFSPSFRGLCRDPAVLCVPHSECGVCGLCEASSMSVVAVTALHSVREEGGVEFAVVPNHGPQG